MLLWGAVCMRESFQLLDDPNCNKLGRQSWVLAMIISTEFMVCAKFGWETITKPIPRSIIMWWIAGFALLVVYTLTKFVLFKPTRLAEPEKEKLRVSPIHSVYAGDQMERVPDDGDEVLTVTKSEVKKTK